MSTKVALCKLDDGVFHSLYVICFRPAASSHILDIALHIGYTSLHLILHFLITTSQAISGTAGLAGHVVSSCHTNSGPCHQRTLEIISCPLKSLEALSAGFSLVPTFLHCLDIDPSDKQTDKCSPQMYETSYCDCRCTEGQSYSQSRILSVKSPT